MFCEKCGKNIENNATVCPYCGAEINGIQAVEGQVVTTAKPKNKKVGIIVISVIAAVVLVILAVVASLFVLQNTGLIEREMTLNDVYKITSAIEDGKEYDMKDFRKYESEVNLGVYKTYSFELAEIDDTELIITADKETNEILSIYLFHQMNYINIEEGSEAVRQFTKDNITLYDIFD